MARPRKPVKVVRQPDGRFKQVEKGGKVINGLSHHKPTGEYYILVNGQRQYLGKDLQAAVRYVKGETPSTEVRPLTVADELRGEGIEPERWSGPFPLPPVNAVLKLQ